MTMIVFTNVRRTEYACAEIPPRINFHAVLSSALRAHKTRLDVTSAAFLVAKTCNGTVADLGRGASILMIVEPFKISYKIEDEYTAFYAGDDRSPGVNTIRDMRRRVPPFLPDGTARG